MYTVNNDPNNKEIFWYLPWCGTYIKWDQRLGTLGENRVLRLDTLPLGQTEVSRPETLPLGQTRDPRPQIP